MQIEEGEKNEMYTKTSNRQYGAHIIMQNADIEILIMQECIIPLDKLPNLKSAKKMQMKNKRPNIAKNSRNTAKSH